MDFDSAAWKKKSDFSLLPKAKTCFPIIADACFVNDFTCLIIVLVICLSQQMLTLSKLLKLAKLHSAGMRLPTSKLDKFSHVSGHA